MPAVIEITGVSKSFGFIQALKNINLMVHEGEFVSLIGPSGCGKTTLLRIVAGLEKPTKGQVRINGDSPLIACQKHQIGIAFQEEALVPSRTAFNNVQLTLEVVSCKNNCLSPEKVLNDFGLGDFLNSYPHQLSGGMRQRVNIACALVHSPKVLLLDEPFGALDELTRESMAVWLSDILTETKQTVLFVTHSVEEAVVLSDKVVVLSQRPAKIVDVISINLPQPRTKKIKLQSSFLQVVAKVRESLYGILNKEAA